MRNIYSFLGVVLIGVLLLVVSSCAVVYISEGNTSDTTTTDLREKHIGATDDAIEVGGGK